MASTSQAQQSHIGRLDLGSSVLGENSHHYTHLTGQPVIGAEVNFRVDELPLDSICVFLMGVQGAVIDGPDDAQVLVNPFGAATALIPISPLGSASLTYSIPNDVALVGFDLRTQFVTVDTLGVFRASDLTMLEVGTSPGGTGLADLVFDDVTVSLERLDGEHSAGAATLKGKVEIDALGAAKGEVAVQLPSGPVTVVFDSTSISAIVDSDVVVFGKGYGSRPSMYLNGQEIILPDVVAKVEADLESGTWSPLTQGLVAFSAIMMTPDFNDYVQTSWSLGLDSQIICAAVIDVICGFATVWVDKGCDWIENDCIARGGVYFGGFRIDCAIIDTLCRAGAFASVFFLRLFLERHWSRIPGQLPA